MNDYQSVSLALLDSDIFRTFLDGALNDDAILENITNALLDAERKELEPYDLNNELTTEEEGAVTNLVSGYLDEYLLELSCVEGPSLPSFGASTTIPASYEEGSLMHVSKYIPLEDRQALIEKIQAYQAAQEEPVFVVVNYSQDISTASYRERMALGPPVGLLEGHKYVVVTYFNVPGSVEENFGIEGDAEYNAEANILVEVFGLVTNQNNGPVVFIENQNQKFGFDDNRIVHYPTYHTPQGDGIPWKSLGIGVEDQVNVVFSEQLILSQLSYEATGVEIIGSTSPQDYNETIIIKGNSLTENATIEVKDIDGNTIGALMVKVLPAKSMILNLVLVKTPEEEDYPNVNFTITEVEDVLNECFKQINMTWTVNPIDQFEFDFETDNIPSLNYQERSHILHEHLRIDETPLYNSRYYPNDPMLHSRTSTFILYPYIINSKGNQINGASPVGKIGGALSLTWHYNKRTLAHENGHRIGFEHPFKEFKPIMKETDDYSALMDYGDLANGLKIRAYQWKN